MGMSASQARLIQLQGRMNDIEYQGQQINQERTGLANQTNELYNSLLDMNVPVPPSVNDYMKVQYSGINNASKFTIGTVIPTGQNKIGQNTYSIDLKYPRSGHTVSKNTNSVVLVQTSEYLGFKEADLYYTTSKQIQYYKPGDAVTDIDNASQTDLQNKDVLVKISKEDYENLKKASGFKQSDIDLINDNQIVDDKNVFPEDGDVYIKCNLGLLKQEPYSSIVKTTTTGEDESAVTTINNVYECDDSETGTEETNTLLYNNDNDVIAANLYYDKNGTAEKVTSLKLLNALIDDGIAVYVRDTSNSPETNLKNKDYDANNKTGYSLQSGQTVYSFDDPEAKNLMGESYDAYLTALRNSFRSKYPNMDDKQIDAQIKTDFYVYFTTTAAGTTEPHFINRNDISPVGDVNSATSYNYDEDGTYTESVNTKDCQLEFDPATGMIVKIGIPDKQGQVCWIDVKSEQVKDDAAFNDAMNQYDYQKVLYDKKQKEINAKTSIIQQQDKNLELKLTRLDNERNALNTEMEAVKKVIQDAIESGFKTFSG